jgi:hypothetical protein
LSIRFVGCQKGTKLDRNVRTTQINSATTFSFTNLPSNSAASHGFHALQGPRIIYVKHHFESEEDHNKVEHRSQVLQSGEDLRSLHKLWTTKTAR